MSLPPPGTSQGLPLPRGSAGKESACNAGDPGSTAGLGRSPGEGRNRPPTPGFLGFPCGSAGKEAACNVGDLGSIPGLGKSLTSLPMSSRLICVAVCVWNSFFLRLHDIPLCGYITLCLSVHTLMDIWSFSTFGLLWIVLLWTRLCKHRLRPGFQFFWVYSQKWSCRNTW